MIVSEAAQFIGAPEFRSDYEYYIKRASRWAQWEEDYNEDILEEGILAELADSAYAGCEVVFVDFQCGVGKYAVVIEG